MKDSIKIFLASSSELADDRIAFERFIRRKNTELNKKDIFLELELWEDFIDAMSRTRLQDEYNKAVKGCDIFVMLFFTKVGKFTREEFNIAFGQFQETQKPLIYTYFKNSDIKAGSINRDISSLFEFQDKLVELGHYKTDYANEHELTHHFSQQLAKLIEPENNLDVVNQSPNALSKYFKPSKSINNLEPKDILEFRASTFNEFYHQREFDEILRDKLILPNKNILLLGGSLSGKTRAAYEALKTLALTNPDIEVIFPKPVGLEADFAVPLKPGKRQIAFIEDIDVYYNNKNYNEALGEFIRKGIQVLTTCRTGPEYKNFRDGVSSKILETFTRIEVGKVSVSVIDSIDVNVLNTIDPKDIDGFDGNIGSIFLPIQAMKDRYYSLVHSEVPSDDIAVNILKSLCALYYSSNFEDKSTYQAEKVNDYCIRLSVGPFAAKNKENPDQFEVILRELQAEKIRDHFKNREKAFQKLASDQTNLNFIEIMEGAIKIEEVYLEKVVEYKPDDIINDLNELYTYEERKANGFYIKTNNFNEQIRRARNYYDANRRFQLMKKANITPNAETFSILINQSPNGETVLRWFEKMKRKGFVPTTEAFKKIVGQIESFDPVFSYVKDLIQQKHEVHYQLFNLAFAKLKTKEQMRNVLKFLKENTDKLHPPILNALLPNNLFDFNTSVQLVDDLVEQDVEINNFTIQLLSSKIKTPDDFTLLLKRISVYKTSYDITVFNVLMEKVESVEEGEALIEKMKPFGLSPNVSTFNVLMDKVDSVEKGEALMGKMKPFGLSPDVSTFNVLMVKVENLEEGEALIEKMKPFGLLPNVSTFNVLMAKVESVEEGEALIEKMKPFGLSPDVSTFNILMDKVESVEEGEALIEKMKPFGLSPDVSTFNILMDKMESVEEGEALIEKMKPFGLSPDVSTFNILMDKVESVEEGEALIEKMKPFGLSPDVSTFYNLMDNVENVEEGEALIEKMKPFGLSPDVSTFNALMRKVESVEEGINIIKRMEQHNVVPTDGVFSIFIGHMPTLETAWSVVKKFNLDERFKLLAEGQPDISSYTEGWKYIEKINLIKKEYKSLKKFLINCIVAEMLSKDLMKKNQYQELEAITQQHENYLYADVREKLKKLD